MGTRTGYKISGQRIDAPRCDGLPSLLLINVPWFRVYHGESCPHLPESVTVMLRSNGTLALSSFPERYMNFSNCGCGAEGLAHSYNGTELRRLNLAEN